ncbi:Sideroflexin FSF1 [Rhodotorula toruloides]
MADLPAPPPLPSRFFVSFRLQRTLILPPILMTLLEKRGVFDRPNAHRLNSVTSCISVRLIGLSLLVSLPPAIAASPSHASIALNKLVEPFHERPFEEAVFQQGFVAAR